MKKTYVTRMPDKAGAFLVAGRIIARQGGNIVRVNYNKAVDLHTLFIEVSADQKQHEKIAEELSECGYLADKVGESQILMIVLTLPDVSGAVMPVLEVLNSHQVNISYISSQENGTGFQYFKMGLFIENTSEIRALIADISRICEIKILDYEVTDRLLDGTVFYVTFANEMRKILGLNQEETNEVLVQANRMMQLLDEQKKSPLKTFDYIRRFATLVVERRGDAFKAQVSTLRLNDKLTLFSIEPPCRSNTYVIQSEDELLFVDCGFACYRKEMTSLFKELFPGYSTMRKSAFITHGDMDHVGILSEFDVVYMSGGSYDNFALEVAEKNDFREQNPLHEPYCKLSRIISGYKPPALEKCIVVGRREKFSKEEEILAPIGSHFFGGRRFDFFEGKGGHVVGDTVIVCHELKLIFSGDIYVNIKGFSAEQKEFNALAPFLMTGVDTDPKLAKEAREYLLEKYKGYTICPGHGAVKKPEL
ncbi:MAG: MBL fold metallo-hydrolase [Treponemataceae bacterium]|nr:MBL fold metallo-hydrolase [Treponemataceae bacterium]